MVIYLDNASTSFPKPEEVIKYIQEYLTHYGVSPNGGSYSLAQEAERIVFETRKKMCELIQGKDPNNLIFTYNATHGLNLIIKGYLKEGDHALICSYSHNSVIRPLEHLKQRGIITYDIFPIDAEGHIDLNAFTNRVKSNTRLVICNHASNVIGVISSIKEVMNLCEHLCIPFLLDCTQSLGYVPIDVSKMPIDFLVGTGHKTLLGPSGIGFVYIKNPERVKSLMEGGNEELRSASTFQPSLVPYKFEAGTLNTTCIAGLMGALTYLFLHSFEEIAKKSMILTEYVWKGLTEIEEITLYGTNDMAKKIPIISFNINSFFPSEIANLYHKKGFCLRHGIQSAPILHKDLGTLPTGTLRISPGHYNTKEEMDLFLSTTKELIMEISDYE